MQAAPASRPIERAPEDGARPAFLFTDIEGSTRRWETMPDAMAPALRRHDEILRAAIDGHGGRVFKLRGDGLGAVFPTMRDGIEAAVEAQRLLSAEDWTAVDGIKVRMAIHAGDVEPRDGDFFGPTLNHLARLIDAGHGGQILISADAVAILSGKIPESVTLVDLGSHQLRDLIKPSEVYQICAPGLPTEFAPLRSLNRARHNLPSQLTPLVGRDSELDQVRELLERNRLVTLLGPGGIGKTRLATQIGAEVIDRFSDGVWFVEFAALSDPAILPNAIAKVFGIQSEGNAPPLEAIFVALQRRKLLLILDNCEHVTEAAAELADALLRRCGELRIVATSREKLGIIGETLVRVGGLSVPPAGDKLEAGALDRWSAIRLFADRALAADGGFVLDDETIGIVADICRRLDGIPLALELAAARLSVLSAPELADSLSDWFKGSARDVRGVASRHRTLHATMDWSYSLLAPEDQRLFRRAGVFAGTWSIEAAVQVLGEPGQSKWDVLERLRQLVDKSLIVSDKDQKALRFRLLETARTFALSQLEANGEAALYFNRHADYYRTRMAEAELAWDATPTAAWLADVEPVLENVRAALEAAFGGTVPRATGRELAAASTWLWTEASLQHEGRRWLEIASTPDGEAWPPEVAARLLLGQARLTPYRDDGTKHALAERAVALFRSTADATGLADALALAGDALVSQARYEEAERCHREAYGLLSAAGAEKLLGRCANSLAHLKLFAGDVAAAKTLYEEARRRAEARGDAVGRMVAVCNLAEAEFALGNYAEALDQCRIYVEMCRAERLVHRLVNGLANLAAYYLALDDPMEARAVAREALIRGQETQSRFLAVISIEHLAVAGAVLGERDVPARLLGFSEAHYRQRAIHREPTERIGYEKALTLLGARLERDELERLMAEGEAFDLNAATEEALKL
jgi:predicted ATPase/class 3 adenylate cyclase